MSTTGRHHTGLGARFIRLAWGRRLETGLTLAITVARVVLVLTCGRTVGLCALALSAAFALIYRPSRDWLLAFYRRERLERRWGKVFSAAGIEIADNRL